MRLTHCDLDIGKTCQPDSASGQYPLDPRENGLERDESAAMLPSVVAAGLCPGAACAIPTYPDMLEVPPPPKSQKGDQMGKVPGLLSFGTHFWRG